MSVRWEAEQMEKWIRGSGKTGMEYKGQTSRRWLKGPGAHGMVGEELWTASKQGLRVDTIKI